ncbi:DUF2182 domain-containing protein [Microbacterium sp.]|uniref:copper chaperone n=1 Tax=Microbacterium sp. TaxID=51671 RepID=UPI0039E5E65B
MSAPATPRTGARTSARVAWARVRMRHPERGLVVAVVVAWLLVIALSRPDSEPSPDAAPLPWSHHAGAVGGGGLLLAVIVAGTWWVLMVVAMMGPVMVPRVRAVAQRCPGRVRTRAVAETLAGALLAWMLVGAVVVPLAVLAPPLDARAAPWAFAALWLAVVFWQLTPPKERSLRRCHGVRPQLGAGTQSQVRPGARYAGWCALSCGPAMAAMALTGHGLLTMVVLTAGFTAERVAFRPRRAARLVALAIAAVAASELLIALPTLAMA